MIDPTEKGQSKWVTCIYCQLLTSYKAFLVGKYKQQAKTDYYTGCSAKCV